MHMPREVNRMSLGCFELLDKEVPMSLGGRGKGEIIFKEICTEYMIPPK